MDMTSNTILITGGSSGIGLALAERFLRAGSTVLVTGRNAEKLEDARRRFPGLHTYVSDVSKEEDRVELFRKTLRDFPRINVLFNNAGIMRFGSVKQPASWVEFKKEIETNLEATIHLSLLFSEHLAEQKEAAILITTSGLAHVPLAATPVYSSTKAALHSFALSLRHQLGGSGIRVVEICPPKVDTDLVPGDKGGMGLESFADEAYAALERGELEFTTGFSSAAANAGRAEREQIFAALNPKP